MLSFHEWRAKRLDEAAKKGKPKKAPVARHDIETWLKEIESLKKDLEELKKAKKIAAQKLARLADIEKLDSKKPDSKKPDSKKPLKKYVSKKIKKKGDTRLKNPSEIDKEKK